MKYSPEIYARALFLALTDSPKSGQQAILARFAKLLIMSNRQEFLPEIERELKRLEEASEGQGTVHITFARPGLDEKVVVRKFQLVFGKRVAKIHINEQILGGVIAETDDGKRIDASVNRFLKLLKMELSK